MLPIVKRNNQVFTGILKVAPKEIPWEGHGPKMEPIFPQGIRGLKWDGRIVAGISSIGPLRRATEVVEHREGGDPSAVHKSPGLTRFDPITLERGLTQDTAFQDWANLVWKLGASLGSESALANFRKDVRIELLNEAGQIVLAYNVHRAWVSEYTALPDLDAAASSVAIESMKLAHEGWERDTSVVEPKEPTRD